MKKYALAAAGLMLAASVNANLLVNGDFELPAGTSEIDASGDWTEFGATGLGPQSAHEGAFANNTVGGLKGAWLKGWNSNVDAGFYQNIAVVAGDLYTVTGDFRVESGFSAAAQTGGTGTLDLSLIWMDGASAAISTNTLDVAAIHPGNGSWIPQVLAATAPAGAVSADVQIHWTTGDQSAVPNPRSAMVDNMVAIPEPATFGLMAVLSGGVLFIRRRFMI